MDSYKVVITKQAEESMRNIALNIVIELKNVSAAKGHVDAIMQAIDKLSFMPTYTTYSRTALERNRFSKSRCERLFYLFQSG